VSVIVRKKVYMNSRQIMNVYQDTDVGIYI